VSELLSVYRENLLQIIDTKNSLLSKLVSNGYLSRERYDAIESKPTEKESIELLIDTITGGYASDDLSKLLTALDEAQQKHVANFIRGLGVHRPEFGDDWPLERPQIRVLYENLDKLIDLIDLRHGLMESMYGADCFNSSQQDRIMNADGDADCNVQLMKYIRRSSFAVFKHFLRCLIETKQSHVVYLLDPQLAPDICPLEEGYKYRIKSNLTKLIQNITVDVVLLAQLETNECITRRQRQSIEAEQTNSKQCVLLLDMIRRGSQKDYQGFIECLRRTSQAHVIELLKIQGQQIVDVIANIKTLRNKLLTIIDIDHGLLDHLHSFNILTEKQVGDVQSKPTKSAVNLLLDYIIDMSSIEQCEKFLLALEKTHQKHVANFIQNNGNPGNCSNDWPLLESTSWGMFGHYQTFMELTDTTNGLLDELVSADCISLRQAERIATCRTDFSKNSTLLNIVQRGSNANYDKLIECLLKTKQYVVAAELAPDRVRKNPLSQEIAKTIVRLNAALIRHIVTQDGLTQQMFDAGCITERQKRYIESPAWYMESNTRLLHVLRRGSQPDFDLFIGCLEKLKQDHVKNLLTCGPDQFLHGETLEPYLPSVLKGSSVPLSGKISKSYI